MKKIVVYGASWCGDCIRSKYFLDAKGVDYDYIDIDKVQGAAQTVEELNQGMKSIPTIIFPDGTKLVEPSNAELEAKLHETVVE